MMCTAFSGSKRIATGDLQVVAVKAKAVLDRDKWAQVLIFDDVTSQVVEVDFRGTADDVSRRIEERGAETVASAPDEARGPGRPKLGVVAREVTLLPRHWEWLASQPGGASAALRRLVDEARHSSQDKDRRRRALESAYRFVSAMAGNEAGFEEAVRALFAGKRERFQEMTEVWPMDVRDHARKLAGVAFGAGTC